MVRDTTGILTFVDFGVALDSCLQRLQSNQEDICGDIINKLQTLEIVLNNVENKRPKAFVSTKKKSKTLNVPLPEPFVCPICGENQGEYDALKSHLKSCCYGDFVKQWPKTNLCILWDCLECKDCKSKFRAYNDFEAHVVDLHPTIKTLYCVICSMIVINNEVLYKEHIESKLHLHLAGRIFSRVLKSFDAVLTYSFYRCNTCKKPSNTFCSHLELSKGDNFVIYCKLCDMVLSKRTAEYHALSWKHLSWPWFPGVCPLCGICIVGKYKFLWHIKKFCPSRDLESVRWIFDSSCVQPADSGICEVRSKFVGFSKDQIKGIAWRQPTPKWLEESPSSERPIKKASEELPPGSSVTYPRRRNSNSGAFLNKYTDIEFSTKPRDTELLLQNCSARQSLRRSSGPSKVDCSFNLNFPKTQSPPMRRRQAEESNVSGMKASSKSRADRSFEDLTGILRNRLQSSRSSSGHSHATPFSNLKTQSPPMRRRKAKESKVSGMRASSKSRADRLEDLKWNLFNGRKSSSHPHATPSSGTNFMYPIPTPQSQSPPIRPPQKKEDNVSGIKSSSPSRGTGSSCHNRSVPHCNEGQSSKSFSGPSQNYNMFWSKFTDPIPMPPPPQKPKMQPPQEDLKEGSQSSPSPSAATLVPGLNLPQTNFKYPIPTPKTQPPPMRPPQAKEDNVSGIKAGSESRAAGSSFQDGSLPHCNEGQSSKSFSGHSQNYNIFWSKFTDPIPMPPPPQKPKMQPPQEDKCCIC